MNGLVTLINVVMLLTFCISMHKFMVPVVEYLPNYDLLVSTILKENRPHR